MMKKVLVLLLVALVVLTLGCKKTGLVLGIISIH